MPETPSELPAKAKKKRAAYDKYNIGLDIHEERHGTGPTMVTVVLMDLLKLDKAYTDAQRQARKDEQTIRSLVQAVRALSDAVEPK